MATVVAIAKTREQAIKRLTEATARIAELLNIEAGEFPTHNRDASYLQAQQLKVVADFLERVVTVLTPEVEEDLDSLTNTELKALAEERGIDLTGKRKKDEFIEAIRAAGTPTRADVDPAKVLMELSDEELAQIVKEAAGEAASGETPVGTRALIGEPGPEIITSGGDTAIINKGTALTSKNARQMAERALEDAKTSRKVQD